MQEKKSYWLLYRIVDFEGFCVSTAKNFYKKSGAKVLDEWRTVQMHQSEMKKYLKNIRND